MKPVLFLKFPFSSTFGGGEHHTLVLAEALRDRGVQLYFVGSCSMLLQEFRKRGWPALRWWAGKEPVKLWAVVVFPFTLPFALLGLLGVVLVYRFGNGVRTLYCLSLTEKAILTPFAYLLGMRVIWAEHVASSRRWLRLNPLRPLYAWWSRLAVVMVISGNIRDSLVAVGVPQERIAVIYNGVDLAPFQDFHRRTFHWTKKFIIGSIGRLEPEKGYVYLLRAFQIVNSMLPQAQLILVGNGSERSQLEWLARQLHIDRSVQFVGFQKTTAGWYKCFDCFALPSVERESFGIVLVEALASACPVVASRLGGIPEIIQDGVDGVLVAPADAEALAQALLWIYRNPDLAMHQAITGQAKVAERFSKTVMLDQLLRLFA